MYPLGCRTPRAQGLQATRQTSRHRHAVPAASPAPFAGLRRHNRHQVYHGVHAAGSIEPHKSKTAAAAATDSAESPSTALPPASAASQQPDTSAAHAAAIRDRAASRGSSDDTGVACSEAESKSGATTAMSLCSERADTLEQTKPAAATTAAAAAVPEYVIFTAEDLQSAPRKILPVIADATPAVSDTAPVATAEPIDGSSSSSSNNNTNDSADVVAAATAQGSGASPAAADSNTHSSSANQQLEQEQQQQQLQLQDQEQGQQQLLANLQQQAEPQQQQQETPPLPPSWSSINATAAPPPLIDSTIDIANDPAYAIRLMDILDQISVSSLAPASSSAQPVQVSEAVEDQPQLHQPTDAKYKFIRQPAAFCTNCCTPLDPLRPAAACSSCGHMPANDSLLFSLGASSLNDLSTHSPPWLQQHHAAAAAAAANSALDSTKVLSQRIEAGIAAQQARQLLQDAGILQLPTTLLAWEDDQTDPEPAMQLHRGLLPPNHERPERLKVVLARLRAAGLLDICGHLQPREATDEELLAVHTPGLVAAVAALSHADQPSDLNQVAAHLAPDMLGNRYTYRAARTAAGTAAELAEQLVSGKASNGMAIIRPMGHAAGVDSGEAGSYFNNAAVAVRAAQRAGARRVMVIDWDVHHCKGTSEIFAEDPNVVVFSLHRYGNSFYPGSGAAEHVGVGRGRGRNINVAWCPPSVMDKRGRRIQVEAPPISDGDYLTAWNMLVLPVAAELRPDIILVSAGFDAADKDPLGQYRLHPELFGHLTALLRPLAPLGLLLEGGYNLSMTAACTEACLRALLGERPAPLRGTRCAGVTGWASILRTLLVQQEHWQSLGMLNFLQLATPVAEDWEVQDEAGEEEEDDGYTFGDEEEEAEEQELPEEELGEVLAAATDAKAAGKSVDDFEPEEVVAAISEAPDLLQQVLDLLDQKIEASKQKQLEEQLKAAALEADAAAKAAAAAEQQQQLLAHLQQNEGAGEDAAAADAGGPAGSSSSKASSWSAGGFMDDMDSVDSGSDDDDAYAQAMLSPGRTDWGTDQIDEDATDHMAWYTGKGAQQQIREAQEAAAATGKLAADVVAVAAANDKEFVAVAAAEAAGAAARVVEQGVAVLVAAVEAEAAEADAAAALAGETQAADKTEETSQCVDVAVADVQQRQVPLADLTIVIAAEAEGAAVSAEVDAAAMLPEAEVVPSEAAVEPITAEAAIKPDVAAAEADDAIAVTTGAAASVRPGVDAPAAASFTAESSTEPSTEAAVETADVSEPQRGAANSLEQPVAPAMEAAAEEEEEPQAAATPILKNDASASTVTAESSTTGSDSKA